jgi:hypothetical protein
MKIKVIKLIISRAQQNISDEHFLEAYMGGLKEDIKRDIFLRQPTSPVEAMQNARHIHAKIRLHTSLALEEEIVLGVIRQPYLNQQGWHVSKWMKEEKKDYVSIVKESTVKGIDVMRRNYST